MVDDNFSWPLLITCSLVSCICDKVLKRERDTLMDLDAIGCDFALGI